MPGPEYRTPVDTSKGDFPSEARVSRGYEKRDAHEGKGFADLFGSGRNGYRWTDRDASFFQAALSGRFHPDLTQRAMNEGTPSDGGFLLPIEYSKQIHTVALESEIILPRCQVVPMISNEIRLPAMEIGSHVASLYGGFVASWKAEASTLSQANPKARQMTLNANKLVGFCRLSNELVADMNGTKRITDICGKGLAFYRDSAYVRGSGVGEPQGLLNAACKITVAAEAGQAADTLMLENINKMVARLYQGGWNTAIWLISQTCLPQLLQTSISVGTGGSAVPLLVNTGGKNYIYGKEVIFTEHCSAVGTEGDIILTDLSQFLAGVREEMRIATSEAPYFDTDETALRLVFRGDGQSLWDEALTMKGTSTTVSPIVTLEDRA